MSGSAWCKNLQRSKPENPSRAREVRKDSSRRRCSAESGKMSRGVFRKPSKQSLSRARAECKQRWKTLEEVGIWGGAEWMGIGRGRRVEETSRQKLECVG